MPTRVKDPEQRQRRNKAATAATLPAPGSPEIQKVKAPPLNAQLLGIKGAVRPQVKRWWEIIWREPMAARWLKSDIEGLYMVALLRQQIAVLAIEGKPVASMLGELRQQEGRFGLDVLSRRRLDWRIEGTRQPEAEPERPHVPAAREPVQDPRSVLRALP